MEDINIEGAKGVLVNVTAERTLHCKNSIKLGLLLKI